MKDIPLCNRKLFISKMFDQTAKFVNRMRWRAFFYELHSNGDEPNPADHTRDEELSVYSSRRSAPEMEKLKAFEGDLFNIIKEIKFRNHKSEYQKTMQNNIKKLLSVHKLIVPSDKTSNLYYVNIKTYKKLLLNNITKDYKITNDNAINSINSEAARILASRKIKNKKIPKYVKNEAFITLKDHKPNFPHSIKCRTINPSKSHIGRWCKTILQKHLAKVRVKSGLTQWKNSKEVTNWFSRISNKFNKCFVNFDIVEFYPSITKTHVINAINFSNHYSKFTDEETEIILHSCQSVLCHNNSIWCKKNADSNFDIAMGSFHGAEICDLVGLFLLNKITSMVGFGNIGLYRDDGLGIIEQTSGTHRERLKKKIIKAFNTIGFKITIDIGSTSSDFLDVSLNLLRNHYQVYSKPNTKLIYINKKSNHPPSVRKQLPKMIENRLINTSINENTFNTTKSIFQTALNNANYNYSLQYKSTPTNNKQNRRRKCTYYNPPFCQSVKTKIGTKFIELIGKHFGPHHPYHKIFNRKTLKISYCCSPNIKAIINGHNKRLLNKNTDPTPTCNCRANNNCPVEGKCQLKNVIYRATVTSGSNDIKQYIGSTSRNFKKRLYEHRTSFPSNTRIVKPKNCTELANHIWKLKDKNIQYHIKWEILHHATISNNPLGLCSLCNLERCEIAKANRRQSLNRRNELVTQCPHKPSKFF